MPKQTRPSERTFTPDTSLRFLLAESDVKVFGRIAQRRPHRHAQRHVLVQPDASGYPFGVSAVAEAAKATVV